MEVVLFEEMVQAGIETLREERARKAHDADMVKAIYLSMQAILEIAVMRDQNETRH
jgi:hypothetical protein